MLVPIESLNPGDRFIDLDPNPHLDVTFTVKGTDDNGRIVAEDEYGYEFHFHGLKIVRILSKSEF